MRFLHMIASVDRKGGGPIEGLIRNAEVMKELGHDLTVVSLDDPSSDAIDRSFPFRHVALGPAYLKYGYAPRLYPWLKAHSGEFDAVIVQGIWQYHSFATWRALRKGPVPYFVFTHGMLDPWFKQQYPLKHLKKWLYWPWADYRVLRDARAVFFTTEEERLLARQSFWLYRCRERVVVYGTRGSTGDAQQLMAVFRQAHPELGVKPFLLFLGRIHQKKGCDDLIRAFAAIMDREPDLLLVMAGPDDVGLSPQLKKLAVELGVADRILWPGMLTGDVKWGAIHAARAFVLSSHQENFGIAVAEALSASTPVLISDKVNIWREIEQDGAGLVGSDTVEGCEDSLNRFFKLGAEAEAAMRLAARRCFESRFEIHNMSVSLVKTIQELM